MIYPLNINCISLLNILLKLYSFDKLNYGTYVLNITILIFFIF